MCRVIRVGVCVLVPILWSALCLPLYADSCSDAKSTAEKYFSLYEDIRRMIPEEQTRFVEAACDADEEERSSVMEDAGHRVESNVLSKADELSRLRDDANKSLQSAMDRDECKDQKDDLDRLQKRVDEVSRRVTTMSNGVRAGNNPVFAALRDLGQKAHKEYQAMNSSDENANSKFGTAEVSLSEIGRRVDFLDPKECQVVELKPDANSSAQEDGFKDAKEARDWLNKPENLKAFIKEHEAYAKCKKFVARVDCYHFCPGVADDGSLQVGSLDWKTGCKGPE